MDHSGPPSARGAVAVADGAEPTGGPAHGSDATAVRAPAATHAQHRHARRRDRLSSFLQHLEPRRRRSPPAALGRGGHGGQGGRQRGVSSWPVSPSQQHQRLSEHAGSEGEDDDDDAEAALDRGAAGDMEQAHHGTANAPAAVAPVAVELVVVPAAAAAAAAAPRRRDEDRRPLRHAMAAAQRTGHGGSEHDEEAAAAAAANDDHDPRRVATSSQSSHGPRPTGASSDPLAKR